MPAEPHIRSPFPERLAPQTLILEVIGLGRAGPHCMAAYHSQCLRRSARPDPTGLIRPRGTRDNDSGLPECLSLPSCSCRHARSSLRATIVSRVTGAAVGRTFSLAARDRIGMNTADASPRIFAARLI